MDIINILRLAYLGAASAVSARHPSDEAAAG